MSFVLLCCVFSAVLIYARGKFAGETRGTDLQVARVCNEKLPFAGQPISIDVKILNAGPNAIRGSLEDEIPEDCMIAAGMNRFEGVVAPRSQLTISYSVIPSKRKTYVFPGVRVESEDEYGLFRHSYLMEEQTSISVHTSKESLDRARKLAGKEHLEYAGLSRHLAMVMYDLEFDKIREYIAGDRARDIHWKLLAKLDELFTRVYTREGVVQTMVFIDCSSSMRRIGTGLSKMDHSIDLCMQISKVLLSSFHATGVCLLDEVSVVSQVPPSIGRRQFDRIVESLRKVPPPISAEAPEARVVSEAEESPVPPSEVPQARKAKEEVTYADSADRFLSVVRSLGSRTVDRSSGVGFDGVVRNMLARRSGRKLMAIVITDMVSSRDAIVASAGFAGRKGSKMLVIHLCDDWYEYGDEPFEVSEMERMYDNLLRHVEIEGRLRRAGASYIRIGPADTTTGIVRAMRLGRT
jgi:uncharacterized protein (DUF58 family)